MNFASLSCESLWLSYGKHEVIRGLDVSLLPGGVSILIGANGCGKSTLLRGLAGLMPSSEGRVMLEGQELRELPRREVARRLGLLPQSPKVPAGVQVGELVALGRAPYTGWLGLLGADDKAAVARAMRATDVTSLAEVPLETLSGGQRQRAWLAMALAQEPEVLLLDEPTTFLDIVHQLELLEVVVELNRRRGTTVVVVLHDINLAARYADELVVLKNGQVIAQGTPREVVTPELLHLAFGLEAQVMPDPVAGTPMVVPRVLKGIAQVAGDQDVEYRSLAGAGV